MRRRMQIIIAALVALTGTQAAAIEFHDWSWEGGLLGDRIEGDVFDDDANYPGYLCDRCRDPEDHPVDYAAVAYNGYFGETPWMRDSLLGIPFRIYGLDGRWIAVWFEDVLFDMPSFLPNTLDIRIRLPDGRIVTVTVLQDGPDMPVGSDESGDSGSSCDCGGGGGGDEGDDDYTEPDDYEPPDVDDPEGIVEIIDPDDDGEFPEWIEEL